MVAVIYL